MCAGNDGFREQDGVSSKEKTEEIPMVCQWMRGVYLSLSSSVKYPMLIMCVGMFSAIRLTVNWCLVERLGWPATHKMTIESVSFLPPVVHSLLLCPVLYYLLTSCPYRPVGRMDESPLWWQQTTYACMDLCTAYMIYDSIFIVLDANWYNGGVLEMQDFLYLGHHFATSMYMSSTRWLVAGHSSAMMLMFLGEFTNPFQNIYCWIRFAVQIDAGRSIWHTLLPTAELLFAIFYAFFRTFLGPGAMAHITYHLVFTPQGRSSVPIPITILWLIMGWGVLIGSVGWTMEAIEMAQDGLIVKYDQNFNYGPGYEL